MPAVSRGALAQAYPSRPVKLVIGYPPGGSADITARLTAQFLGEKLGQSVIVESRPGGGTNIATETVINAPADGYTLLLVAPANAINATLYEKLNHNYLRDTAQIAGLIRFPNVIVVNPSVPVTTVPELIAHLKANPGKLNMASSGNGSTIHMSGELFKMMTGTDMTHVPYRGGALALTDMVGGQVQVMFDNVPTAAEFIKSGKLRGLAVTSTERSHVLPELPTVAQYVPGYEASAWYGLGAPKNTPRRDHRDAEQGGERDPRRRQAEGALHRDGRLAAARHRGRVHQARRRRDREVGQGGEVRGREGDITLARGGGRSSRTCGNGRQAADRNRHQGLSRARTDFA